MALTAILTRNINFSQKVIENVCMILTIPIYFVHIDTCLEASNEDLIKGILIQEHNGV